jgi:hypothetical protein
MELRYLSLQTEFEMIADKALKNIDKLERNLRKINKGYHLVEKYIKSPSVYFDNDYENCERLFKQGLIMYQNYDLFNDKIEIIKINKKSLSIKSFGNIKLSINLNARRFKTSKYKVHEFSNQLGSIGAICKLNDQHYVATNPTKDSLVVFDEQLKIVKIITSVLYTKFSYPMAICTNNIDNIYVCDCHNLRVLVLNKELDKIKITLSTSYNPTDICFDSNYLYILYSDRKSIHKFTSDGVLLTRFELKPMKLNAHSEIDPMRIAVQNTKIVALYSNNQVYIHDIVDNLKLIDNPREISCSSKITSICFSSPFLMTICKDGECYFYDIINNFADLKSEYKIIYEEKLDIFSRSTPCFVTYFDEFIFVTFQYPMSHWLMKIDIK